MAEDTPRFPLCVDGIERSFTVQSLAAVRLVLSCLEDDLRSVLVVSFTFALQGYLGKTVLQTVVQCLQATRRCLDLLEPCLKHLRLNPFTLDQAVDLERVVQLVVIALGPRLELDILIIDLIDEVAGLLALVKLVQRLGHRAIVGQVVTTFFLFFFGQIFQKCRLNAGPVRLVTIPGRLHLV